MAESERHRRASGAGPAALRDGACDSDYRRKEPTQLQDNLGSAGVKLNEARRQSLDEASAITLGFPHDFYADPMVRNFVYGGLRDRTKA